MIVTHLTPVDSPPVAFTSAEIYKIAQHFRWIRHEEGYESGELYPDDVTSSQICQCGERLWLLDIPKGPRSRVAPSITCPVCDLVQPNEAHFPA